MASTDESAREDSPETSPPEASSVPPQVRLERLRTALAEGRITREAYAENVRALRVVAVRPVLPPPPLPPAPEPEPEPSQLPDAPIVNPPPPPLEEGHRPSFEERIALMRSMFADGRISRRVYEVNLARAYEPLDGRLARLREAREAGRITQATYDANVRRLLAQRGFP